MNNKVTCKRIRPNPVFEDWLTIMYEDARATKSNLEGMLKEALESLVKYPLPLKSGAECLSLQGFDKRLCAYLDKLLNQDNNNVLSKKCEPTCNEVIATSSDISISSPLCSSKNAKESKSISVTLEGYQSVDNTNNKSTELSSKPNTECYVMLQHIEVGKLQDSATTPTRKSISVTLEGYQSVDITNNKSTELSSKPNTECYVMLQHIEVGKLQDSATTPSVSTKNTGKGTAKGKKGEKKAEKYKPAHRSGGYAILVALLEQSLENPNKCTLTKEELIEKAQKHAEESLVQRKNDSYYNGWSSMSTLQKKGLVTNNKRKNAEYRLTEEGKELAREILKDSKSIPPMNDIIFKDMPSTSTASIRHNPDFVHYDDEIPSTSGNIDAANVIEMTPGTFDIILLIDKNETGGLTKKSNPVVAQVDKYPDLSYEYRNLKVGDFTWIAKHKVNKDQEIVLPFIIERKRMDDLGASIKDGRYHEQKFRLRKCGIDNVLYMVENYGKNKNVGLPIQNLMQAIANIRVQEGFKVHMTDSLTNSVRFLAMLTKRLTIRYKDKHLRGCNADPQGGMLMTFDYFNKTSAKSKPLTVTDTFIKLLLQLKGMSVDKALAITKKYPTPRSLINAYLKCDRKEGETLLVDLKFGDLNHKVGPAKGQIRTNYHKYGYQLLHITSAYAIEKMGESHTSPMAVRLPELLERMLALPYVTRANYRKYDQKLLNTS